MTYAGQLIKALGLQMYSGAVPAIAELVSNAYDAMARNVWIEIPLDRSIEPHDEMIVRDDGRGMTYDECNSLYLEVGRDRRAGGEWTEPYGSLKPRRVQGRKGIGKLSGFGIANRIEIRTVREREVSHFAMDYAKLTRGNEFVSKSPYHPEPLEDDGKQTRNKPATQVSLTQLKISRTITRELFFTGLARRLLVLDEKFRVHVNGERITRDEIPFQFRFPEGKGEWETVMLENGHEAKWWAGFCKVPIKDDEQRGFVVFVRGKSAQDPWFFDLSGGAWGQHGMQYMTGEIQAEFLDDAVDLVGTGRRTLRWEHPLAVPLKAWGQKKVRSLLGDWVKKRTVKKRTSRKVQKYLSLAEKLPQRESRVFRAVVDRITSIPQTDPDEQGRDLVDDLVEFVYSALTNRTFLEVIRQLNSATPEDRDRFRDVLSEWDIIEAINTAHLVKGRVAIIRKFRDMLSEKVPEKPDMQDYMKEHPWLIDPKWTMLWYEKSLDKLICEHFGIAKTKTKEGGTRLDFFCLGDQANVAHVVELKHPGELAGKKEIDQTMEYVDFLQQRLIDAPLDNSKKRTTVSGVLICREIRPADLRHAKRMQDTGDLRIWQYQDLLRSTLQMHRDFLRVVKGRAPADDPRIAELDEIEGSMASLPGSKPKRKKAPKKPTKKRRRK